MHFLLLPNCKKITAYNIPTYRKETPNEWHEKENDVFNLSFLVRSAVNRKKLQDIFKNVLTESVGV